MTTDELHAELSRGSETPQLDAEADRSSPSPEPRHAKTSFSGHPAEAGTAPEPVEPGPKKRPQALTSPPVSIRPHEPSDDTPQEQPLAPEAAPTIPPMKLRNEETAPLQH
jgi:hypothetical protein